MHRDVPSSDWKPDLDGVLLAQHVVINSLSQNPSFIEVFTEFRPLMLPFHAVFFIVLGLRGVRESCELELTVGQENAWSDEYTVPATPPKPPDPICYAAIQVVALLLEEGGLSLSIGFQGTHLGRRYFPITVPRPQLSQQPMIS